MDGSFNALLRNCFKREKKEFRIFEQHRIKQYAERK